MRQAGAVFLVIAASFALWCYTINVAWDTGDWVGGADAPREAQQIAFTPSIVDLAIAIPALPYGIWRRSYTAIAIGISAILMSGFLLLLTGWFLAMGAIT